MKKYINNIFALILLLEGLYLLYSFALIFTKVINTWSYTSIPARYIFGVYIITILSFILAGIGLWKNKNWAIICGWVALLLPQLLKFVMPLVARLPLQNNYIVLVVNIIILIYLSTQWNKLKSI